MVVTKDRVAEGLLSCWICRLTKTWESLFYSNKYTLLVKASKHEDSSISVSRLCKRANWLTPLPWTVSSLAGVSNPKTREENCSFYSEHKKQDSFSLWLCRTLHPVEVESRSIYFFPFYFQLCQENWKYNPRYFFLLLPIAGRACQKKRINLHFHLESAFILI